MITADVSISIPGLDQMVAKIGARKAQEYANRHRSNRRQEMETFWKHSNPTTLTEE